MASRREASNILFIKRLRRLMEHFTEIVMMITIFHGTGKWKMRRAENFDRCVTTFSDNSLRVKLGISTPKVFEPANFLPSSEKLVTSVGKSRPTFSLEL